MQEGRKRRPTEDDSNVHTQSRQTTNDKHRNMVELAKIITLNKS